MELALTQDASTNKEESKNQTRPDGVIQKSWNTPKIWAVGGGKGGVGKSLISANFSWILAQEGHSVAAVDLDLGGSNLHTCLGMSPPQHSLSDWKPENSYKDFHNLFTDTRNEGLSLLSGARDPLSVLSHIENHKEHLLQSIRNLPVDHVVLDLGAGTHLSTLDFFNAADEGILSIIPEPTSVENAHRFIRGFFYQKLLSLPLHDDLKEIIQNASQPKNDLGVRVPADLFDIIEKIDPQASKLIHHYTKKMKIHLVINQVRSPQDIEMGKALCSISRKFYGIHFQYSGYIDYDQAVWKAIRNRKTALEDNPLSLLSARLKRLSETLIEGKKGIYP